MNNSIDMKSILRIAGLTLIVAIGFSVLSLTGCPEPDESEDTSEDTRTPVSIKIVSKPTKTQYKIGEDLETRGMVVMATYEDGTKEPVTGYTIDGYDKTRRGSQTLTVTYKGKTDEFTVKVIDPNLPTAATPTTSVKAGSVNKGTEIVLVTDTEGAEIWYTTNNNEPAENGPGSSKYTAKIIINTATTIKAVAVKEGWNDSGILLAVYTIPKTAMPAASPTAGSYIAERSVTLTTTTAGAKIYYTTNGTDPTTSSNLYSGAINIQEPTTLKAIAVKDGWDDSDILTAVYNINMPIELTKNVWAEGDLPHGGVPQWFKFTATESTQYIHINFDKLEYLYVQVYDSSETAVGDEYYFNRLNSRECISRTVKVGQVYYIKVWPPSSYSGTFKIGFNTGIIPPGVTPTPLTENVWTNGNLSTSNDVQWFMFTATTNTHYIHANFVTLNDLYVQVYDSSGDEVESQTNLFGSTRSLSRTVSEKQVYYIKVWPRSSYSGTYKIGFNTTFGPPGVKQLTENTWEGGNLLASSDEQWFMFTATASTQWIHANFGTLNNLYVQVYDSSGATVGSQTNLSGNTKSLSRTVTAEQDYYIKVWPRSSYSGTYKIGFNTGIIPPGVTPTTLAENVWAKNGNLPTSNDVQWFKFTATASTQWIHAGFGTLNNLYVQVYNSSGATVGSQTNLFSSTKSLSRPVTAGQEYYIKVSPYSGSGTYQIGFNTGIIPPEVTPTSLTVNEWASGNLPTSSDVQWFKFTATTNTQWIHANFGTLNNLYVQVYNSSGATVGSQTNLFSSTKSLSRPVTAEQEYYIKVWPSSSSSGTYQIGFNTTFGPLGVKQLTENTWEGGNLLASSDEQWFMFTATASTQWIHANFGTLNNLYVQMYDSNGATVGSQTNLFSSTRSISRTVTAEQDYYIKVWPPSSYSGTYQIAFNASETAPSP